MKKNYCSFLLLFLTNIIMFGQSEDVWRNYTNMSEVRKVAAQGNLLWAATTGGLFGFSIPQQSFTQITQSEGLSNQILTSMALGDENSIWMGSSNGSINILDLDNFSIRRLLQIANSEKTNKSINDIYISGDTVFVSTAFGLSIFDKTDLSLDDTFLKFGSFPSESPVQSAFKHKLIYVVTSEGIAVQKLGATNLNAPESWNVYDYGNHVNANQVYKFGVYNDEVIAASSSGLLALRDTSWMPILYSNENILDFTYKSDSLFVLIPRQLKLFHNNQNSEIVRSSEFSFYNFTYKGDGSFYFSTNNGAGVFKNGELNFIFPNSPASNLFTGLSVDSKGNLWSASGKDGAGKGVYKFDGLNWFNYNRNTVSEITFNDFHKTFAGNDEQVFLCTWGRGFSIYQNDSFKIYNAETSPLVGIPSFEDFIVISGVCNDSKGNIWVLNYNSAEREVISVLTTDGNWHHYKMDDPFVSNFDLAEYFVIDQYDNKWFSIKGKGVYYFNENGTFESTTDDVTGRITSSSGLTSGDITALALDKRGELWIGKTPGINILSNPGSPTTSSKTDLPAFRNQLISDIAVDAINQKWIATKEGVFVTSPDGYFILEHFTSENSPLPNNDIKSIVSDDVNGIIYIGTDFGLTSIKTASISPSESLENMFVFPNPFVVGDGKGTILTIDGLVSNSELKLLSINGKLIKTISAGSAGSPGGNRAYWDGTDENGNFVTSGVYLIVAFDQEANNVGTVKVAVIHK
ncbi:MAG: hypothetical protein J5I57_02065 [Melioribacteraceae bacterium]|nr:hypothetical protein [Melioribacteraceae bacterium]